MLITSGLLAATAIVQPASQTEFEAQAAACHVDLKYETRGEAGFAAILSKDGRMLILRTNQDKAGLDCLKQWAKLRGLPVILRSN